MAYLAHVNFAFTYGDGHSLSSALPGTLGLLGVAGLMGWIVLRCACGGFGQRGPRIAVGLLVVAGLALAAYAAAVDPGDAAFTVPVLLAIVSIFGLIGLAGPQK